MAGVLNFQQFIGGPDQVKIENAFPSDQRVLLYNFGRNTVGWTFNVDHQTLICDQIAFNRNTNQPNFSNSMVIGSFAKVVLSSPNGMTAIDETQGTYKLVLPSGMYTGAIIPDARVNVPITVVGVTWTDTETPAQVNTHRWVFVQCWEPGVTVGDPKSSVGYTALVLA